MGEIVNLRLVKKRKAREAKDGLAAENRIRFSRTKAEKQFEREAHRKTDRFLDQNKLENPDTTKAAEERTDET